MRCFLQVVAAWLVVLGALQGRADAQDEARVTLTLAPAQVRVVREGSHDRVDLTGVRGALHPEEGAGLPDLPMIRLRVALPAGARPGTPRLEAVKQVRLPGVVNPAPVQPPRIVQERGARSPMRDAPPVPADARVYGSAQPYPATAVSVVGTARMGGAQVALVHVTPLVWNPGTGALDLLTELTVVLPYTPAPAAAGRAAAPARSIPGARALVANPSALPPAEELPAAVPGQPRASLVILTDDHVWERSAGGAFARGRRLGDMAGAFQPLADDHTALGLEAKVVRISDIVAGRFGDCRVNSAGLPARDLQEVLRNFIQDRAYPLWGTRYLLLGGDVDIVPARRILEKNMDWYGVAGAWTDAEPWNAFSAICRSWWPGCVGAVTASPSSAGVEKMVDGDAATGWAPPVAGGLSILRFRPATVEMRLDWPNAIWPAYNKLRLIWDTPPAAWKPILVRVSSDGGRTWSSRGTWPAGAEEFSLGRGAWIEQGSGLRVSLIFPLGWPRGSRLMELEAYGARLSAYPVDANRWMLVGAGMQTHQPLLFQQSGRILAGLVPYSTTASAAAAGWHYVSGPGAAGDAPPASTPTPYVMVEGPASHVGGATRWARAVHPVHYVADAYYGDVEGDEYAGGAAFDAQSPWHDFDRDGDGWCSPWGDGIDSVFEVGVGRAPVHDEAEAALFVRKVRTYLRYRDIETGRHLGDFARRGLLGAEQLWGGAPAGDEGFTSRERIKNTIWLAQDPTSVIERYYQHPDPFPGALPFSGLTPAFSRGWNRVGILSHSGPDYCTGFTPASAAALVNAPFYSVVFSYGCSPNAFDHHGGDSVSEAFVNATRGGACAFMGNSRYGWGGDHVIEDAFWEAVTATPRLGDMIHAREARGVDSPWLRMNLLGDPALPVWSRVPAMLSVQASLASMPRPAGPPVGPPTAQYRVSVMTGRRRPVEGALVAVTEGGRLAATVRTDAQGGAIFFATAGAVVGISAVSEPTRPDRAFIPVIAPLATLLRDVTPGPTPIEDVERR